MPAMALQNPEDAMLLEEIKAMRRGLIP